MQSAEREDDSNRYILVNDTEELTANSEVIIVVKDYNFAMSTTQNSNNRGQATVSKTTESGVTYIESIPVSVQRFTLEAGTTAGSTIAFKCINDTQANKYIYAASNSKNYLKSQDNLDDNASFTITFENGSATLLAQGTNSHNWIAYNKYDKLFSCYSASYEDAVAVSIYKLVGSGTAGEYLISPTPHIKVTSANPMSIDNTSGNETITYTITHPVSGESLSATSTASWISNIDCSTSGQVSFDFEVNNNPLPRSGIITLSYNGAESVSVTVQQAGSDDPGYSTTYTSNVTFSGNGSSQAYKLTIDGVEYDGMKSGSNGSGGSVYFEVPAGTTKIYFHAQGWGTDDTTLTIDTNDGDVDPATIPLIPNSQYSGNGTSFTITTNPETDFFEITASGITESGTRITLSSAKKHRFVVWGINVE